MTRNKWDFIKPMLARCSEPLNWWSVQIQVRFSGSCGVMDQCEADSAALQLSEEQQQEEHPSNQSVPDQMEDKEQPTQGEDGDGGDEWDTDLETDNSTSQRHSLSRAEVYLQACQQTGAVPVSSFLRNMSDANLNLNHYGVGPCGAKALAIALQNDIVITTLELEDNALRAQGTRYLMEMLQTNITIQSLNLSNNQLHLEGANVISKMLLDNYYIKSLKLSGNDFDDAAAKYLTDALKGDYVVTELDLSHNKFSEAGGANSTLKRLYLSCNGFGHMEAESLGQALKQNHTLELLDLSSNHIDDHAVTLLCQGLATNSTLRVLKLSHNTLTDVGALTLLRTVKNNRKSAVEEIDISTVFVYEAFVELLEEVRQGRPALDVRYSIMTSVTRNLSALHVFQKFLEERNESIMDFFQALDKEGTLKVSTSAFRKAVKAANVPLDQRQLEWLIKKFDKNCTATIIYRLVCGSSGNHRGDNDMTHISPAPLY
ncbi:uncharacterized protein ABDE67_016868 [Symphorus nematophorus]